MRSLGEELSIGSLSGMMDKESSRGIKVSSRRFRWGGGGFSLGDLG
jgi:hypothetical protein